MVVTKDDRIVLQGKRDVITGLWRVSLQILDKPPHKINNIHQVNGKENVIRFVHTAALIPVKDTWARAVNWGYFDT